MPDAIEPIATPTSNAWPETDPSLLEEGRPSLPAFPLPSLPPWWRAWVSETAHGAGAPVDYVVQALLASVAGVCGAGVVALKRLSEARLPFISVMTDPTTGGVSASLAMLGDINIGEPKALIGFAGPRVIQQTVRETLPEGFQRSEFLLEHGALDMIVDRRELRDRIGAMLRLLSGKEPAAA